MIKEEIGRGATPELAIADARLKLGISDDHEIQFDILTLPKKKVMGLFGGCDAEVKVWIECPDEKPAKSPAQKKNSAQKKDGKKEQKKDAPKKAPAVPENAVPASELPEDSRAKMAAAYLETVLTKLGCENISMKIAERDDGAGIYLEGEGLGIIIGRRGETLDALQHLVSLSARNNQGYYKVTLNIGDYRERREDTLASLAKRVADQVLKTGKGKALEPMNPYERRIIHTTVQEIEGVTSASVGEGENRRVVIVVEGGDINEVRIERRGGRGRDRDRRGGRGGRDRRGGGRRPQSSNTVATAPTRAPKSDSDVPLYGKIK